MGEGCKESTGVVCVIDALFTHDVVMTMYHVLPVYNLSRARHRLDEVLYMDKPPREFLILGGDRTLAAEDTGEMFWARSPKTGHGASSLKELFGSPLDLSYCIQPRNFDVRRGDRRGRVSRSLRSGGIGSDNLPPVPIAITPSGERGPYRCHPYHQWATPYSGKGPRETGSFSDGQSHRRGRLADVFVITAVVKTMIVQRLRDEHHMYVWAFGDSPPDLPMLSEADEAVIVVGDENSTREAMDVTLLCAIEHERPPGLSGPAARPCGTPTECCPDPQNSS